MRLESLKAPWQLNMFRSAGLLGAYKGLKHCRDFWKDIIKSVKEGQNHYLGTITLEEKGNGKVIPS